MAEGIALFEKARSDAVALWPMKMHLWEVGSARFPNRSKQLNAINGLCWWDPVGEARCLADDAACRFADRHGDALFARTVDGIKLRGPTTWFYNTLPQPRPDRSWNRTRRFGVDEFLLLENVDARARQFVDSVEGLPLVDKKRVRVLERQWERKYAKARKLIVDCSTACQGYLWLLHERKVPAPLAVEIASYWRED